MSAKLYRSPMTTVVASVLLTLFFGALFAASLGMGAAYAADESTSLVAGSIAATEAQPDPQPAEMPASPNTPGAPEAPAQQDDETPQQEAPEETPQEEGGQEEPDAGYDEPENDAQD